MTRLAAFKRDFNLRKLLRNRRTLRLIHECSAIRGYAFLIYIKNFYFSYVAILINICKNFYFFSSADFCIYIRKKILLYILKLYICITYLTNARKVISTFLFIAWYLFNECKCLTLFVYTNFKSSSFRRALKIVYKNLFENK